MSKGIVIDRCITHGLPRPTFVQDDDFLLTIYRRTPQVTPQVIRVLRVLGEEERSKQEIMDALMLSDTKNFKEMYLQPALASGLIEMTIPDKPTSRNQKYRKTKKGKELK